MQRGDDGRSDWAGGGQLHRDGNRRQQLHSARDRGDRAAGSGAGHQRNAPGREVLWGSQRDDRYHRQRRDQPVYLQLGRRGDDGRSDWAGGRQLHRDGDRGEQSHGARDRGDRAAGSGAGHQRNAPGREVLWGSQRDDRYHRQRRDQPVYLQLGRRGDDGRSDWAGGGQLHRDGDRRQQLHGARDRGDRAAGSGAGHQRNAPGREVLWGSQRDDRYHRQRRDQPVYLQLGRRGDDGRSDWAGGGQLHRDGDRRQQLHGARDRGDRAAGSGAGHQRNAPGREVLWGSYRDDQYHRQRRDQPVYLQLGRWGDDGRSDWAGGGQLHRRAEERRVGQGRRSRGS